MIYLYIFTSGEIGKSEIAPTTADFEAIGQQTLRVLACYSEDVLEYNADRTLQNLPIAEQVNTN